MKKGDRLNIRQEAYCIALAVDGLSQRQAYIKAYGEKNASVEDIDRRACLLANKAMVLQRISELRSKIADEAIWSKAEMLRSLRRIADECECANITIYSKGSVENVLNVLESKKDSAARSVAVKAIDTASKMLGYNAPEKVENSGEIKIIMSDELKRYGE